MKQTLAIGDKFIGPDKRPTAVAETLAGVRNGRPVMLYRMMRFNLWLTEREVLKEFTRVGMADGERMKA